MRVEDGCARRDGTWRRMFGERLVVTARESRRSGHVHHRKAGESHSSAGRQKATRTSISLLTHT